MFYFSQSSQSGRWTIRARHVFGVRSPQTRVIGRYDTSANYRGSFLTRNSGSLIRRRDTSAPSLIAFQPYDLCRAACVPASAPANGTSQDREHGIPARGPSDSSRTQTRRHLRSGVLFLTGSDSIPLPSTLLGAPSFLWVRQLGSGFPCTFAEHDGSTWRAPLTTTPVRVLLWSFSHTKLTPLSRSLLSYSLPETDSWKPKRLGRGTDPSADHHLPKGIAFSS